MLLVDLLDHLQAVKTAHLVSETEVLVVLIHQLEINQEELVVEELL